jgi:F-type H+-transporting ATPase subunit gamma
MTRLREVIHHLDTLADIREIMNAMKNLAIIESRKLDKVLDSQHVIVDDIDTIATDYTDFHPFQLPLDERYHLYILIGAERGFSGSFNHQLQQHYRGLLQQAPDTQALTIAIGRKFATTFTSATSAPVLLDGASAQEEISHVLNELVTQIEIIQSRYGTIACTVVRHDQRAHDILVQPLLPPFQNHKAEHTPAPFPPQLYLLPQQFLSDLIQQYLFAQLYSALSASLLAENEFRVAHLEGAIRHLDERSVELGRLRRSLRQEEIIEEIEVILLNAGQSELDTGNSHEPVDKHDV